MQLKTSFLKRIKAIAMKPHLLILFCVCMVVALSSFKPAALKASASKQVDFSVRSLFPELEITDIKQLGPSTVQVMIRNSYEKDITAIVASVGEHKVVRSDYIYAELEEGQKLSSGASDDFLYGFRPGDDIVIRAVLFSDMTSEGDRQEVRKVLDKRLGVKIQLARFNPHLERLSQVDRLLIRKELQRVKLFAENLPIQKDEKSLMSHDLEYGLKHGRAFILKYLSKIETELENERIETFYTRGGERMTKVHGGEGNFRESATRVVQDFKGLERRL